MRGFNEFLQSAEVATLFNGTLPSPVPSVETPPFVDPLFARNRLDDNFSLDVSFEGQIPPKPPTPVIGDVKDMGGNAGTTLIGLAIIGAVVLFIARR